MRRVFLIVLDSFGIGEMPDANYYHDGGSNTLRAISTSDSFFIPTLEKMGLMAIDGVQIAKNQQEMMAGYQGCVARMTEESKGKDTTMGHWEISGVVSQKPLPTFPNGFPEELVHKLEKATGRKILCNLPYSGTKVIEDYGEEQVKSEALIVYTSADSVLQIAAHESVIHVEQLYEYCRMARALCTGKYGVGRVIARPFVGEKGHYIRTAKRHDFSLEPPKCTMLDQLVEAGYEVHAVGKINDIFAGRGITSSRPTKGNEEGIAVTLNLLDQDFTGLCFVNLVDFDMLYGHRNDVDGYAKAMSYFDYKLSEIINKLRKDDILMITADHGCDPTTPSTDHSREYTPLVMYGESLKKGINLGTRSSFADIGATILDYFEVEPKVTGTSFLKDIVR